MLVFTHLSHYNIYQIESLYSINTYSYGYSRINKPSRNENKIIIQYFGNCFGYEYSTNRKIVMGGRINKTSNMLLCIFGPNSLTYHFDFIGETFKLSKYRVFVQKEPNLCIHSKIFFNRGCMYRIEKSYAKKLDDICQKVYIQYNFTNNKIRLIIISNAVQNKPPAPLIKKIITVKYRDQLIDNIVIENNKREKTKYIKY